MWLGLDLGSIAFKAVVADEEGRVRARGHAPITSGTDAALARVIDEVRPALGSGPVCVGVTGQGRGSFASLAGCAAENEILCLVRGVAGLEAPVRSLIEIGGQAARWVSLERDAAGALRLADFALNDQCAAGAGVFLTQQAGRLRMDVAELARLAAEARVGASIAGRCAVFAKSDMIHLQQKGVAVDEIAYGLCLALARNFLATVLKGRETPLPVGLAGGGALNLGLVRAFREVLRVGEENVIVLPDPLHVGALGAARLAGERGVRMAMETLMRAVSVSVAVAADPAHATVSAAAQAPREASPFPSLAGPVRAYLGVDVGSVTTDFALVAPDGSVLDGLYLPTRGRPIEVLDEGLSLLRERYGERLTVLGVGTTGSGRHLAARLLRADLAKNEITAQLTGTLRWFPDVDTIFEIGGQDSKYIRVVAGQLVGFTMNKVCAAGTGSFLEEQCEHLGLDVKEDFARLAARGTRPADLGARCTVFMETELIHARRAGAGLPDLLAGLADSVARNYLQRVVGGNPVGRNVVFQGGVASNGAVVAAFGRLLGRPVSVHPFNSLSGAIGVALLVRHAIGSAPTTFRGLGAIGPHQAKTFECRACENLCQVTQVTVGGAQVYFGDICERFSMNDPARASRASSTPDLFAGRTALWQASLQRAAPGAGRARGVIGLPRASGLHEYLPFWAAFFGRLGFEVVLSPPTSLRTLELGTRHLPAETCLPIKLAFGHVAALRPLGADAVFMPSPVLLEDPSGRPAYGCPYTQSVPFLIQAAMSDRVVAPEMSYAGGFPEFAGAMAGAAKELGIEASELEGAFEAGRRAQDDFRRHLLEEGAEALSSGFDSALVVLGRPYNLFDPFLNLNLARHLSRLGVLAFPQGCLPVDGVDLGAMGHDLPWHFPREAMRTALWAARDPRLHVVLVTNFGCGPDAFLQKHLATVTPARPPLVLEFDEHRGEAGMVTRLEAFLDQVAQRCRAPSAPSPAPVAAPRVAPSRLAGRRVFIPYFSDHAHALAGALRWIGAEAELLPPPGEQSRKAGEAAVSGKECHAYAMLMGDLVRLAERRKGAPPATFFYPGTSVPCLLSQFADGLRMDLERRGLGGIEVLGPSMDGLIEVLGTDGASQFWRGLVAADLLVRWLCGHRPYERTPGTADRIHRENLHDLADSLAVDDMGRFLERAVSRMESVPIDRSVSRPLIGVAGDLYTRVSDAANLDLWRKLEAMGCEVWPSPFLVDSVEFGLPHEFAASLRAGRYRDTLVAGLMILRKDVNAWRIRRRFSPLLERVGEPGHSEVLDLAAPYLGPGSPGPLLLNVAKMVDFARRGADGVIHAMCLNCMLGTAASALIDRIRRDHGGIPIANLVYAGSDSAALRTRLETFVYQARAFREARIARHGVLAAV